MTKDKEHLNYIHSKGPFKLNCSSIIFTPEELELLKKYGHLFNALILGELEPSTDAQREFILVATSKKKPITIAEVAWFKYIGRMSIEEKKGDGLKIQYRNDGDSFYNREMSKNQKKVMLGVINDTHSE